MKAPFSLPRTAHNESWRAVQRAFLDALFPPRCAGCATWSRAPFCGCCTPQLKTLRAPMCDLCGEPFDPLAFSAAICAACRAASPPFRAARAGLEFAGPIREAIHRFKYHQKSALAPRLAPFLARAFDQDPFLREFEPQILVPIPLHRARLRKRGFNQSFLLARELSPLIGVPTRELLRRTRNTPPQVTLRGQERANNVKGAFAASPDFEAWQGARILLIDDVFTSGSTLAEAARTLCIAGAGAVCALTLAR